MCYKSVFALIFIPKRMLRSLSFRLLLDVNKNDMLKIEDISDMSNIGTKIKKQ